MSKQRGGRLARAFSSYAAHIYRWAVLLGLSANEAEDAAQDALATASRRIKTCQSDKALTSWLFQITRRVVANHRRKSWLKRWLPSKRFDEAEPEEAFRNQQGWAREHELETRRCLRRLPPELAEVLVMFEVMGMTRTEVARLLGIPVGTVASRLRRARAAFLEQWQQEAVAMAAAPLEESP